VCVLLPGSPIAPGRLCNLASGQTIHLGQVALSGPGESFKAARARINHSGLRFVCVCAPHKKPKLLALTQESERAGFGPVAGGGQLEFELARTGRLAHPSIGRHSLLGLSRVKPAGAGKMQIPSQSGKAAKIPEGEGVQSVARKSIQFRSLQFNCLSLLSSIGQNFCAQFEFNPLVAVDAIGASCASPSIGLRKSRRLHDKLCAPADRVWRLIFVAA